MNEYKQKLRAIGWFVSCLVANLSLMAMWWKIALEGFNQGIPFYVVMIFFGFSAFSLGYTLDKEKK